MVDSRSRRLVDRSFKHTSEPLAVYPDHFLLLATVHTFKRKSLDSRSIERYTGFHFDVDSSFDLSSTLVKFLLNEILGPQKAFFVRSGSGNLYVYLPVRDFPLKPKLYKYLSLKLCRVFSFFGVAGVDYQNSTCDISRRFCLNYKSGKPFKPKLEFVSSGRVLDFHELDSALFKLDFELCKYIVNKYAFAKPTWRKCLCNIVPLTRFLLIPPNLVAYMVSKRKNRSFEKTRFEVLDISRRYKPRFKLDHDLALDVILKSCLTPMESIGPTFQRVKRLCELAGFEVYRPRFYRRLRALSSRGVVELRKLRNGRVRLEKVEVNLWS